MFCGIKSKFSYSKMKLRICANVRKIIDGSSVVVKGVLEDEFLDKISEVIQMPSVKILIESLYHQSTSNFYPS